MLPLKDLLNIKVRRKVVCVELWTVNDRDLHKASMVVCHCLNFLQDMDVVKHYKNRRDYFIAMPQNDWQPVELMVGSK